MPNGRTSSPSSPRSWRRFICLCVLLLSLGREITCSSPLYFTNQSFIERLQDNVAVPVINAGSSPLNALDCNACDDRIYWINQNEIKRSFPNESEIETVLNVYNEPKGVAVDWRSNNVYFTVQLSEVGRVGVVSCDGHYQRIFTKLNQIVDAGPIVVDPVHGFMYYSDTRCCIWKAKLDGTDPVLVIADISHIKDITIDFDNSKLYWIDNDVIYNSNLDGSDVKMILNSSATGISIINSTLYWTQSNMQGVGSILSYSFVTNVTNTVLQMANLVPGDISSIISKSYIQSINVGCSNNNGGCKKFCFTLPQSSNVFAVSSNFTCSCPTGFKLLADGVSCNLVPESFLLIAANKKINIVSFDIPSESNIYLPLPIDISGTVEYVAYDLTNEFVYWSQQEPPAILRSKIDGSAREVIVNTSIALPVGVAISDDGSTLFWADVALNKIEAVAVSFVSNDHRRKTIVDTGLDHPQGLAINEALGYIYWTDSGIHPDIKRANLDGSNQVQIITSNVMLPGPLAIHRSTGNIYWSERHHGGQAIWKANKDGGNRVKLTNLGTNDFRGLSFIGDVLYISDRSNGIVKKLNIKSSIDTSPDVVADSLQHPLGITAINDTAALNHYGCLYPTNGGCGDICVPTGGSNSSAICICRDNYTLTDNGKDCAEGSDSLLIISSVNEVLMAKIPVAQISIPISVRSFDIDINNNKLYWINNSDGSLYRTDLPSFPITGSTLTVDISEYTIERLIESIAGSNISDLAVDWWGKNIYWTDSVRGLVGVSKLNGKNQQILASGLQNPRHIVIDPYLSNLYVSTDIGIQYVPLSGGAVTTLWTSPTNHEIKGLTVDIVEHFLFWTYDICLYEFRLLVHSDSSPIWCNYNHNDMPNDGPLPTIISYLKDKVYALLPTSHEVYEIDEHASEDSNDVSFRELGSWSLLFDHFTNHEVTGMKFHHFTVQPGSHWCTRSNGECSGDDTLCLVKDLYYYKCVCPSNTYQSVVYDQDREICRTHCNNVESFLLFSTITDIMHLPVRDPALASFENSEGCPPSSLQPRPLNLGIVSDVKSITYDPLITRHVVWIEGRQVRSAGLDGSSPITLATYPYTLLPSSMTNDWYGGHILWTDDLLPYIDILRFNGRGSGVLLNEQQQRYNVTAIAMDSFKRYLYFANSFDLSLNSMNFGTSSLSIHKANIRKKAYITQMSYEHNNNTLCWYDELNKSIDVFFITTKNLITIVGNVVNSSHVTALTAVTFKHRPLVFWYNMSDWSIYYHNITSDHTDIYVRLTAGTIVTSMVSHNIDGFLTPGHNSYRCASSNCTDICIVGDINDNMDTVHCACPNHRTLIDSYSCSNISCGGNFYQCGGNSSVCIPFSWLCDGQYDCIDHSDEFNCSCHLGLFQCYDHKCIERTQLCDNQINCNQGEDEFNCTTCSTVDCIFKATGVKGCISEEWVCDGEIDCIDGQDEPSSCSISPSMSLGTSNTFSSSPTNFPPPSGVPQLLAILLPTVVVIIVMVLVMICLVGIALQCINSKKRIFVITHSSRYDFPSIKSSTSPQPNPHSINTSDISINTIETRSTNLDKSSQEMKCKRLSISTDPSNPPNSPITRRSLRSVGFVGDEMSIMSRPLSEMDHPVPKVPCPSMNYDAISDNISSVSQPRLLAVYPPNGLTSGGHHAPTTYHHHHHMREPPTLSYIDEDTILFDEPIDYQTPSLNHSTSIPLNNIRHSMDNISESTISMTTFNDEQCSHFMGNNEEDVPGSLPHNYDCPPPPSPVTEYSMH